MLRASWRRLGRTCATRLPSGSSVKASNTLSTTPRTRSPTLRPGTSSPSYEFRLSIEIVVGGGVPSLALLVVGGPGQRGDRFVISARPHGHEGDPVTRQGRSEPASGAGRVAALTGNEAVGGSQPTKRSPVSLPF